MRRAAIYGVHGRRDAPEHGKHGRNRMADGKARGAHASAEKKVMNGKAKTALAVLAGMAIATALLWAASAIAKNGVAAHVNSTPVMESDVTAYVETIRASEGAMDAESWGKWLAETGNTPATMRKQAIDALVAEKEAEMSGEIRSGAYEASDAEVAAWARDNAELLAGTRNVRAITFAPSDREQAQAYADRIGGSSLEFDAACTERLGSPESGDIGWTGISGLDPEIEKAVAGASEIVPTGVIETSTGDLTIVMWKGEYAGTGDLPQSLRNAISGIISSVKSMEGHNAAMENAYRNTQVTVYPMPEGLPYDL